MSLQTEKLLEYLTPAEQASLLRDLEREEALASPSPAYAPSSATLTLVLEADVGTRIGAFGICSKAWLECPGPFYPHIDPSGAGDTSTREFTFKPTDELFVFGKLFANDGSTPGGVPVDIIFEGPTSLTRTVITGGGLAEFNTTIKPGDLLPGTYTVTLSFPGA